MKRLLRAAGLAHAGRSLGTAAAWDKLLATPAVEGEPRGCVAQHRAMWQCAEEQVAALEASPAAQEAAITAVVERLRSVPGVRPIVALTAIAVFSDAASYADVVPAMEQSGDRDAHGRITKRGWAALRAMPCEAAHHAARPTHPLHPYFAKLCAKRGYKMAVVAVAHRLCRILFAMLRDGTAFDIGKLGIEEGPFRPTTVRRYRLKAAPAARD